MEGVSEAARRISMILPTRSGQKRKEPDFPGPPDPSDVPEPATKRLEEALDRLRELPDNLLGDIILNLRSLTEVAYMCRLDKRIERLCGSWLFWMALYYGDQRTESVGYQIEKELHVFQ